MVGGADRRGRDEHRDRQQEHEAGGREQLRAVLTPRQPCHRSLEGSGACGAGSSSGAIYASRSSSSPICSTDQVGVDDRAVGAHEQRQLAPARTLAHDRLHAADATERPPCADQQPVGGKQILDRSVEPHAAMPEQDDALADALDVAQQARGDDDGRAGLGRALHQEPQKVAARQGVEPRQRLVEQEQRGALAEGERQRELRSLARRERRDARLRRRAREQLPRECAVPARIRDAREIEHVADGEAAVERRALRHVADVGERRCVAPRVPAEIATLPSLGSSRPTARPSNVDLPAPFDPAMPTIDCSGTVSVQSRSAHAPR